MSKRKKDMKETITLTVGGIKCDNTSCDYEDMTVAFDPDKWLGVPCPRCGESLFTQADYDAIRSLEGAVNWANKIFPADEEAGDDYAVSTSWSMDGTGSVKFKLPGKP